MLGSWQGVNGRKKIENPLFKPLQMLWSTKQVMRSELLM